MSNTRSVARGRRRRRMSPHEARGLLTETVAADADQPALVDLPEPDTPALAELAATLAAIDRLQARVATLAVRAGDRRGDVADGLPLGVWLSQVGRLTRSARDELTTTARTLTSMPQTAAALADGRLSWSQTVAICRHARQVCFENRQVLDRRLGMVLDAFRRFEPDELVDRVDEQVTQWAPDALEKAERAAAADEYVALQADLFGGGRLWARLGTVHFAEVAEAFDADLPAPPAPDLDAAAQAAAADGDDPLTARRRAAARHRGRRRAVRLVDWARHHLSGCPGPTDSDVGGGGDRDAATGGRSKPRPGLLLTIDADSLLDRRRTPAWLLTTLAGGRMKVSAGLARRLVHERGADVRTIVLDDCGRTVGVGRRTRVAPGWLRDAMLAQHLVDTAPDSRTPVRLADLDHLAEWDADHGRTDGDNLFPVGRGAHVAKTARHWDVVRDDDGMVRWVHTTGLAVVRPPTRWGLDRPWQDTLPVPGRDAPPPDR